ncbi:MAG: hypothetical protein RQ842_03690 [Vulcanisaeta sp.]|nr:hypothetical protein [Vulcanisaeta sp.]
MSAIGNILKNTNFWLALIIMAAATATLALGVSMMPTSFMLGFILEIVGVVMAGLSTTLFVVTGVQAARKQRRAMSGYV